MFIGKTGGSSRRSERREAMMLIAVSLMFVVAGGAMWLASGSLMGLAALFFFGACLLAGIMALVGPESGVGSAIAIVSALMMAIGCGLMAALALADPAMVPPGRSALVAVIAGVVGVVFFGGGGVVLLVRWLRGAR